MALPLSGTISLSLIKEELGFTYEPNFSLDTAENGQYVTINPCSQYKPLLANPTNLSEWYGYNHNAPCNSYEFISTISDIGTAGSCEQTFNPIEARQNVTMYYNTDIIKVGSNPEINSLIIYNIEKFSNVKIEIYTALQGIMYYIFQGNGATYIPWNLVPNQGSLTEYNMILANNRNGGYIVRITYNDGSGRVESKKVYFTNPKADGYLDTFFYYSNTAGTVCSVTSLQPEPARFYYPITVGGGDVRVGIDYNQNGYYRMKLDPTAIYQVTSGKISAITSC
jgi:hypothetical protein